ncbi:hypothetical protein [Janibacter anophelis]|uniref:hypothetical protein n=2 Tax=Janibacter anophelis TaxID=319054 RepID=UPI0039F0B86A
MRLHTRPTVATASLAAALVALAGCGGESEGTDTTTSASSSSASSTTSEPTYDEAHIMGEVKKANTEFHGLDPNAMIAEDVDWATDAFRKSYNDNRTEYKEKGVVLKGKVTTDSLHLAKSEPDAPGGWYVSVYNCSSTTVRAYLNGKDVTLDPSNPDKLLPKGPRDNVFLDRYSTPDDGASWLLDNAKRLTGKEVAESPCAN